MEQLASQQQISVLDAFNYYSNKKGEAENYKFRRFLNKIPCLDLISETGWLLGNFI